MHVTICFLATSIFFLCKVDLQNQNCIIDDGVTFTKFEHLRTLSNMQVIMFVTVVTMTLF